MKVSKEQLNYIKQLAMDNYDTWGSAIVECYTDEELIKDIQEWDSLDEWLILQETVWSVHNEIRSTAF